MNKIKVNLGAGQKPIKGFVNCDIVPFKGIQKVFDINEKWDFKDNSVDYLECRMVFEHVQDIEHFLRELFRVLKVKGYFKITTINFSFWRYRLAFLFGKFAKQSCFHIDHCWLFKPSDLEAIFRQHCFRIKVGGKGLLPYPNLFYSYLEFDGYKCSGGKKT